MIPANFVRAPADNLFDDWTYGVKTQFCIWQEGRLILHVSVAVIHTHLIFPAGDAQQPTAQLPTQFQFVVRSEWVPIFHPLRLIAVKDPGIIYQLGALGFLRRLRDPKCIVEDALTGHVSACRPRKHHFPRLEHKQGGRCQFVFALLPQHVVDKNLDVLQFRECAQKLRTLGEGVRVFRLGELG